MRELVFRLDPSQEEELLASLWEAGTAGVVEGTASLRAFFDEETDVSGLLGRPDFLSVEDAGDEPAAGFSTEDWTGIQAGERFFIAPPWLQEPTPPGRTRIIVDAGSAFGTGRHETTQLMIAVLEKLVQGGETVLDIGCGTGILGQVVQALGAASVVGCDIDALAVRSAHDNFGLPVFLGSADALPTASADILLVNISSRIIDLLAAELKRVTKPGGRVLLGGITHERTPATFTPEERVELGDWQCWIGARENFTVEEPLRGAVVAHPAQWW